MTIHPLEGAFTVSQIRDASGVDWTQPFPFISRTDEELSLVCPNEASENLSSKSIEPPVQCRTHRISGFNISLRTNKARVSEAGSAEGIMPFARRRHVTQLIARRTEPSSSAS